MPLQGSLEDFNFSIFEGKSENEIYKLINRMSGITQRHKLIVFTLKQAGLDVDPEHYEYYCVCGDLRPICDRCGKPGKPCRQNTAYNNISMNWAIHCKECQQESDEYWAERWAELRM